MRDSFARFDEISPGGIVPFRLGSIAARGGERFFEGTQQRQKLKDIFDSRRSIQIFIGNHPQPSSCRYTAKWATSRPGSGDPTPESLARRSHREATASRKPPDDYG